jgi:hypothetical protein
MGVKKILYSSLIMANLAIIILVVIVTVLFSFKDPIDFPVFYGAARNALQGFSVYTYYGLHHLPFWYFPWVSWVFMPLTIFLRQDAWIIYIGLGFIIAFLSIHNLANQYQRFNSLDRLYMFSMLLWMGWQVYAVGQMSFLLLGAAVLAILLVDKNHPVLAGLSIPLFLMKPHLFIIFIPVLLWLGGKKTLITGILFTILLIVIATLVTPRWMGEWLGLLAQGSSMVDTGAFFKFTTFPTLIGFSQNYLGTANMPFTIVQILIAAMVLIRFRSLPKIATLSMALAASLFCAPRSYSYDLVLLIPAMIWLSEKWSARTALLWVVCAVIPIIAHYSVGSYFVTLIVLTLCVVKAITIEKQTGMTRSFFGKRLYPAA